MDGDLFRMLKEMGKTRKSNKNKTHKRIKCPYCKKEINEDEVIQEGYIEKYSDVTICECPYCGESFNIK